VIFLLVLIFMREKPPTAPSSTQSSQSPDLKSEIKAVFKNKNFIILMVSFGIILGMMNTYGTIIGILTSALSYGPEAASVFGAVFIIGGIIGSAVFGILVEIKKNYRAATITICGISSIMPLALMFSFLTMNDTLVSVCCFITGFAMIAILPVGMDFGVELTHPTPEPVSSGLLMSSGAVVGIVLTITASESIHYFEEHGKTTLGCNIAQIVLTVFAWVAFITSFFIKEDLRRIKEAKEKEQIKEESAGP
jgi:predicted MFS family arabinose efflux permease